VLVLLFFFFGIDSGAVVIVCVLGRVNVIVIVIVDAKGVIWLVRVWKNVVDCDLRAIRCIRASLFVGGILTRVVDVGRAFPGLGR